MTKKNVIIIGAAGRDFHNFNTCYRDNESYNVVAFTAAQIPDIFGRKYPARFLVESAQGFVRPGEFLAKLKAQGFRDVCAKQYFFGNVWLYEAVK